MLLPLDAPTRERSPPLLPELLQWDTGSLLIVTEQIDENG